MNKRQRNPKGQSIMDNPETRAMVGTRHRTKKNTTQKTKQMSNMADICFKLNNHVNCMSVFTKEIVLYISIPCNLAFGQMSRVELVFNFHSINNYGNNVMMLLNVKVRNSFCFFYLFFLKSNRISFFMSKLTDYLKFLLAQHLFSL